MFGVLLWKEIRNHLMTFRFGAALITTFVLVLVSVWVLGDDFIRRRNLHNTLAESYAESTREVLTPSQLQPVVQRPPSALGIFAQGEDEHLGNAVTIRRWEVPRRADNSLTSNRLLASMPTFDLLTIFVIALSLFGVLLSYDGFSGERERGTLRHVCACPTTRGIVFAAKFVAGSVVLIIPFLLSFASGLAVLNFVHGIAFTGTQWLSIALMILAGLLYGSLFIAIGLISSALSNRSSTSLALALLFWVLGVVVIPSVGTGLASTAPLEPPQEISRMQQTTFSDIDARARRFWRENNLELSSEGDSNIGGETPFWFDGEPQWLIDHMRYIGFYEALYQQRADQIWAVANRHIARKREQFWLGSIFNAVAPAHHLRRALTALAGTDYAAHAEFMEECRRYRQALLDDFRNKGLFSHNINLFFSRRTMSEMQTLEQYLQRREDRARRHAAGEEGVYNWNYYWDPLPADYAPPFGYRGGQPDIENALWPITALAFLVVLAFAIGFAAFTRYDVR